MGLRHWLRTVPDRSISQVAWRVLLLLLAVSAPAAICMITIPAPWGESAAIALVTIPCAYFLAIGIWPGIRNAHIEERKDQS